MNLWAIVYACMTYHGISMLTATVIWIRINHMCLLWKMNLLAERLIAT